MHAKIRHVTARIAYPRKATAKEAKGKGKDKDKGKGNAKAKAKARPRQRQRQGKARNSKAKSIEGIGKARLATAKPGKSRLG